MTRTIKLPDEAAERRFVWLMGYTFEQIVEWADRYEALAQTYRATADAELKLREFETSRGKKWSATYHARRSTEWAALNAERARIYRAIAESTPTCQLPEVSKVGA